MYPPADDNYGMDSCSIMCLQTTPPIVIIAMCTGKIYHAILLKEDVVDDHNDNEVNISFREIIFKGNLQAKRRNIKASMEYSIFR